MLRWLSIVLCCVGVTLCLWPHNARAAWVMKIDCGGSSQCAALTGGRTTAGPYATKADCEIYQKKMAVIWPCVEVAGSVAGPAGGGVDSVAANMMAAMPSGLNTQQTLAWGAGAIGAQMLATGINQLLFGDPRANAQRQAAEAERRRVLQEENFRRAQKEAADKLESQRQLLAALKTSDTGGPLGLKMTDAGPGGGLQLKTGDGALSERKIIGVGISVPLTTD